MELQLFLICSDVSFSILLQNSYMELQLNFSLFVFSTKVITEFLYGIAAFEEKLGFAVAREITEFLYGIAAKNQI